MGILSKKGNFVALGFGSDEERSWLSKRLTGLFMYSREMIFADPALSGTVLYGCFGGSMYVQCFDPAVTAGELLRIYSGSPYFSRECSECGGKSYLTYFSGSPLSGSLFASRWFCPHSRLPVPGEIPVVMPEDEAESSPFGRLWRTRNQYYSQSGTRDYSMEGYRNLVSRCLKNAGGEDTQYERSIIDAFVAVCGGEAAGDRLLRAVGCDLSLFEKVAPERQTVELCEYVLSRNPRYFRLFNGDMKAVFSLEAVKLRPENIACADVQTQEMCLTAIDHSPFLLQHIKCQSAGLCLKALAKEPKVLKHIKNQTEELCLFAVLLNPKTLQYVKNQTEKICYSAVRLRPKCISMLKQQTPELCKLAVKQAPSVERLVKDKSMLE
jgi:hypothetical protein